MFRLRTRRTWETTSTWTGYTSFSREAPCVAASNVLHLLPITPFSPIQAGASAESSLIEASHIKEDTSPWQLFSKDWRRTTAVVWLIWFTSGFTYYGAIIIGPEVFTPKENEDFDFPALFISSLAEVRNLLHSQSLFG
jgi:hypothetical protein